MVVAGGLERADDRSAEGPKDGDEPVVLGPGVENRQAPPAMMRRGFDEHLVACLGDIDRYQNGMIGNRLSIGHGSVAPE